MTPSHEEKIEKLTQARPERTRRRRHHSFR